jgi:hypothetical protein
LLGYYSTYADPSGTCSHIGAGMAGGARGMEMMAGYGRLMRALATSGDPRLRITQSGPPLPLGKLAMYSAMTFTAQTRQVTMVTERGNVRPIPDSDPIFSVPSGFTQEK